METLFGRTVLACLAGALVIYTGVTFRDLLRELAREIRRKRP